MKAIALALLLACPRSASAETAPVLSADLAASSNDLQRAVWACESGARSLSPPTPDAGLRARFFLSGPDPSVSRSEPPLALSDGALTGLGRLSDERGWSNIRFSCGLTANLRQATAFAFTLISSIPASGEPPAPGLAAPAGASGMRWYIAQAGGPRLVHGVKATDDQDFIASCGASRGAIEVELTQTVKGLSAGDYVVVSVASGPRSALYVAKGVANEELGSPMPVFTAGPEGGPIGAIAAGRALLINIGHESVYQISVRGGARPARAFLAACAQRR